MKKFLEAVWENGPFVFLLGFAFALILFVGNIITAKECSALLLLCFLFGSVVLGGILAFILVAAVTGILMLRDSVEKQKEIPGTRKKIELPGLKELLGRYYDFRRYK